jgi:septal ring factor EnvC (AmiA/AmiB activator)
MSRILLAAILSAFVCLAAQTGAALAQQRITSSELEQLRDKVETQRGAYHLLDMAEKEAREEGAQERAAAFATAKEKARQKYNLYNEEFKKAQAQKTEQDKRAAQDNPDYK